MEIEHIVAPAVRDERGTIFAVALPSNHSMCMRFACESGARVFTDPEDQGFITNHGRFVDRLTAMKIAQAANQVVNPEPILPELFSENLYK